MTVDEAIEIGDEIEEILARLDDDGVTGRAVEFFEGIEDKTCVNVMARSSCTFG